jgi:hypothetical protein
MFIYNVNVCGLNIVIEWFLHVFGGRHYNAFLVRNVDLTTI